MRCSYIIEMIITVLVQCPTNFTVMLMILLNGRCLKIKNIYSINSSALRPLSTSRPALFFQVRRYFAVL